MNAMLEQVIVVHDFNGGRVACSVLRPDVASPVGFWHDGGCYAEKAGWLQGGVASGLEQLQQKKRRELHRNTLKYNGS